MTLLHETVAAKPHEAAHVHHAERHDPKRWLRFILTLIITAVALVPVAVVVLLALRPATNSSSHAFSPSPT